MARATLLAALGALGAAAAHGDHGATHAHNGHVHPHVSERGLPNPLAVPFRLDQISVTPGSRLANQRARNIAYLLAFNRTDLACQYTAAANLTGTFASPSCNFIDQQGYWGHYLGHWLSATALAYNATSDPAVLAAGQDMVQRLAAVQSAWTSLGPATAGFLFPYSPVAFDNLFGPPSRNCAPVCVPWYVYHKVLAGLLDQHTLAGSGQALSMAIGMGAWAKAAVEGVLAAQGQAGWQSVLNTEWGGMNDGLYTLYEVTGDPQWAVAAGYFNHWAWSAPLAVNVDDLTDMHANTHIPEVIGDLHGYELTGNSTKSAIAFNFFGILNSTRTFATGGSNDHEHWGMPNSLGDQMDDDTEESCTTYNIAKLSRRMFGLTTDPRHSDFYSRAFFNGLLGNQATTGQYEQTPGFIYMLPLGGGGLTKPWGSGDDWLPCCWGTLSETFSKVGDSAYFQSTPSSPSTPTLYVTMFLPSAVTWEAGGLLVNQTAVGYPYSALNTTLLEVATISGSPVAATIAIRVPFWATGSNSVLLNGAPLPASSIVPGAFLNISRTWADGDSVSVSFPPSLRWERLNDNRTAWEGVGAILYGDLLLAGVNTAYDTLPINRSLPLSTYITRNTDGTGGYPLSFTATFPCPDSASRGGSAGRTGSVQLVPIADVTFEQYAVYWHTADAPKSVGYNASGYSVLPASTYADLRVSSGASVMENGADLNIRTGGPGDVSTVTWTLGLQDPTHPITGASFSYRYVSGYGPAGRHRGANFTVALVVASTPAPGCDNSTSATAGPAGTIVSVLYTSPELTDYPFDVCPTCYSPYVNVTIPAGSINVSAAEALAVALITQDNDRNLQIDLPLPVTVFWG